MKRVGYDQISLDADVEIEETTKELIARDVVIAREIVQPYDIDGETKYAYKPADELAGAFWTAEGRWIHIDKHPDTIVISRREDIHGRMMNLRFVQNLKDAKTSRPNQRGVIADLHWFKEQIPPSKQQEIKDKTNTDVSIGFLYDYEESPGKWNGDSYDFIQRNIFIDHLAGPVQAGRCPMPLCGIGADHIPHVIQRHATGDPFGEYESWEDCIEKARNNPDIDDPEAYCGKIKAQTEDDIAWMEKAKSWFTQTTNERILNTLIDALKKESSLKWFHNTIEKVFNLNSMFETGQDMSLEEVDAKINELREQRNTLNKQLDDLYAEREPVTTDPKMDELWQKISDLDMEIQAYMEAKAKLIIENSTDSEATAPGEEDKQTHAMVAFIEKCMEDGGLMQDCVAAWNGKFPDDALPESDCLSCALLSKLGTDGFETLMVKVLKKKWKVDDSVTSPIDSDEAGHDPEEEECPEGQHMNEEGECVPDEPEKEEDSAEDTTPTKSAEDVLKRTEELLNHPDLISEH